MRKLRWILPGLALAALAVSGCFIASAQLFAQFGLPNPFVINDSGTPLQRVQVDLNTVSEYADNKDKLKGLSDIAIVGKFTNLQGPAGAVEVWITPGVTNFTTVNQVKSGGTKLWGPMTLGATGSVHNVSWDEGAELFTADGKKVAIDETMGDGEFTIYFFGTVGTYNIQVSQGGILLTISAGV